MTWLASLPVPLAIVPPEQFTYPYYLVVMGFLIAFAAFVAVFPSLRNYRRKRNIILYVAAVLVVSLFLFQIDNVGRWSMININCNGFPEYMPGEIGQLTVDAESFGDREANFNLLIESVNASFRPEQNFVHVSESAIKVPFLLETRGSPRSTDSRTVAFMIDPNVSGFSFSISWEQIGAGQLVVASCDYFLCYAWNGTRNAYVMNWSGTFT